MRILVLVFSFFVLSSSLIKAQSKQNSKIETLSESEEKVAVVAALSWLKYVDNENYNQAWKNSSTLLKSLISLDDWNNLIKGVKDNFGKVTSRKIKSTLYKESLPGVPDGRYLIIQFDVDFKNKLNAVETITPRYEDGIWKVSGYYIK